MVFERGENRSSNEITNLNSNERTGLQPTPESKGPATSTAENAKTNERPELTALSSAGNSESIKTRTEPKVGIQLQTLNGGCLIPVGETVWYDWQDNMITKFSVEDFSAENGPDGHVDGPLTACLPFRDPRRIFLEHDEGLDPSDRYQIRRGPSFLIPWAQCEEWKDMKKAIRSTYEDDMEAQKKIDEGDFELSVYERRVLPRYWSSLIEPNMSVRIRLGSHDDDSESEKYAAKPSGPNIPEAREEMEKEVMRTGDSSKTTYRVDYYVKSRYSSEPDKFLHSNYYDNPVAIEFRKDSLGEHSVIEEVKTITFGDYENVTLPKKGSKAAPKLGKRDVQGDTVLHVHSASLLNALRAVVKYSSNAPIHGKVDIFKEGAFPYPYHDLFHYKEDLMAYKTPTVGLRAMHTSDYNEECDRHIDILIEYLYNEPTIQLAAFEAGLKKATPTVTFAGFWLLVKPGCDVYVSEQNQLNAYVVDSVGGGVNHASYSRWAVMPSSYSVRVWSLVFDGKVIRRKSKIIQVPVFDNELDILSLPVFPTQFHDTHDEGARRKELIARGKQFFAYSRGPAYLEYTGIGLKPGWKNYNRTRVVVEHESRPWNATEFSEMISWHFGCTNEHEKDCAVCSTLQGIGTQARCARCECNPCAKALDPKEEYIPVTFGDYDEIDPRKVQDLSEHQYLVCSSHMFGFILKDRTYDYVDIGGLDEPRIVTDAIDQLVLRPESNKKTIKAIAKTYTDKYDSNELFKADLIRGKGEGQIFLLHGPPGTGKTLTAESIAEFTRRPLLSITAADLGHQPDELEYNLLRFFKNAKLWDGIVLLDEADVYLERRSTNDLMRNSIVSVFLRALEYFQGILFLTTNRVGHFDEAFLSRIHVSIGYEPLDNDARVQIWDGLFRKLIVDHKNGGPEITFEREAKRYVQKDEDVRALNWNGREIRNAFQTAVALAVFDANEAREKGKPEKDCIPEITETHLAQVVRMSTAFKQYIRDTHEGLEDADLAMKLGNRDDKSNQHVARDSTLK